MKANQKIGQSPHFWWIVSLLSLSIIGLVAFILTNRMLDDKVIVEYISYASTLLSITLSIFAILYTYTSNVQIQQQFEKINTAATNIREVSSDLNTTNAELKGSLDCLLDRLTGIEQSQSEMRSKLSPPNTNDQFSNSATQNISNDSGQKNLAAD